MLIYQHKERLFIYFIFLGYVYYSDTVYIVSTSSYQHQNLNKKNAADSGLRFIYKEF